MDIAPLYELRVRLKNAVISGSELLSEDFRLERAVLDIKPLEAASPVFAKIGQLLSLLLSKDCKDRPGTLLDAITLVDAVICTQGVVSVSGELEKIHTYNSGSAVTNAPYSVLIKLLDALGNSGGGRYAYVIDTRKEHPELFEDYRVKHALVKALGASYAELAEEVTSWLKESDASIIPLLKDGFDPKGKKEMVRRLQVIEAIAKEDENDFYLEQLKNAQKDVKNELIYALRYTKQNLSLLSELLKTEKGAAKKMAYWALASMEHEEAREFWTAYVEKNPKEGIAYLAESNAVWASELVAKKFKEQLEPWVSVGKEPVVGSLTKRTVEILRACILALPGKTGESICECYKMAAQIGWNLDRPIEGEKVIWSVRDLMPYFYNGSGTFKEIIPQIMCQTLQMTADQSLGETAIEIWNTQEKSQRMRWFASAFTAQILFHTEKECREWAEHFIYKNSAIWGKVVESQQVKQEIEKVFRHIWREEELSQVLKKTNARVLQNYCSSIYYREDMEMLSENVISDTKEDAYVIWTQRQSPVNGQAETFRQSLPFSSVEGYLTDLVMDCKDRTLDMHLGHWIQPNHPEYCKRLEQYFYHRAKVVDNNLDYLRLLKKCGSTQCAGLAEKFFASGKSIAVWEAQMYLKELPGGWKEKLKEIQTVRSKVKSGKIKIRNSKIVDIFDTYIDELKTIGAGEEER